MKLPSRHVSAATREMGVESWCSAVSEVKKLIPDS
jgi:hypothetical protein